jgi:hypothetical protein
VHSCFDNVHELAGGLTETYRRFVIATARWASSSSGVSRTVIVDVRRRHEAYDLDRRAGEFAFHFDGVQRVGVATKVSRTLGRSRSLGRSESLRR